MELTTPNLTVPDIEILEPSPEHMYRAVPRYRYLLAVLNMEGDHLGWIQCKTLGYDSVESYMQATYLTTITSSGISRQELSDIREKLNGVVLETFRAVRVANQDSSQLECETKAVKLLYYLLEESFDGKRKLI